VETMFSNPEVVESLCIVETVVSGAQPSHPHPHILTVLPQWLAQPVIQSGIENKDEGNVFGAALKLRIRNSMDIDGAFWAPWHELCGSKVNLETMKSWRSQGCFVAKMLWNLHQAGKKGLKRLKWGEDGNHIYTLQEPLDDLLVLKSDLVEGLRLFFKDAHAIAPSYYLTDGALKKSLEEMEEAVWKALNWNKSKCDGRDFEMKTDFSANFSLRLREELMMLSAHQDLMYLYYNDPTWGVCSKDKPTKMMEEEILFEDPEETRVLSRFKPTLG
jgi:hypothetical protein